jgi:hypothetical protein
MLTFNQTHFTDSTSRFLALLDQLPDGGIDPAFDDGAEELERQFAELRMTLDHH